jgi:hypothetical protein
MTMLDKFVRHQIPKSPPRITLELPAGSVPYSVAELGATAIYIHTREPVSPRDMKPFTFHVFPVDRACDIPTNAVFLGITDVTGHHVFWTQGEA